MIRRLINFNPGKLFEQFLSRAYPTVYKINIRNSIIRLDLGFSRWPDLRDGSAWQSLRKLPWLSFLRNERYKSRLRDSDTRDISVTECMEKRKKGERERGKRNGEEGTSDPRCHGNVPKPDLRGEFKRRHKIQHADCISNGENQNLSRGFQSSSPLHRKSLHP